MKSCTICQHYKECRRTEEDEILLRKLQRDNQLSLEELFEYIAESCGNFKEKRHEA